jgi:hypothetical protein
MQCQWKYDWGSVPDWAVAAVAVAAALIAWFQLRAAARAAQDQAQIARASLILEIDRDFESVEMQESRLALRGLRNEIEAFVKTRQKALHNSQLLDKVNEEFSNYLNMLWWDFRQADRKIGGDDLRKLLDEHLDRVNANPDSIQPHERAGLHYQRLTKIFGWLERVAHMANQHLPPQSTFTILYSLNLEAGSRGTSSIGKKMGRCGLSGRNSQVSRRYPEDENAAKIGRA